MAYCTQAQIEDRYREADLIRMADYDGDGQADADVIARAITDADALIDSYLQVKFVVPVTPVPPVLRNHAITIAWYNLELGRRSVTEDTRKAYEDVIAWLKALVAGTVDIGLEPKPAASPGLPGVRSTSKDRLFGRDKPL